MPGFVLVIIAALIGLLAGYLIWGIQLGRGEATPPFWTTMAAAVRRATIVKTQADPIPAPVPATGFPVLHVAREVLEVADHVANPELARRLIEAVVLLPEVSAVRPVPGEGFQPLLHEWAGQRFTDQRTQWNTIAQTLAPGAITAGQALLRPAHVIVFEPPEES
jgi:hypothetical protein